MVWSNYSSGMGPDVCAACMMLQRCIPGGSTTTAATSSSSHFPSFPSSNFRCASLVFNLRTSSGAAAARQWSFRPENEFQKSKLEAGGGGGGRGGGDRKTAVAASHQLLLSSKYSFASGSFIGSGYGGKFETCRLEKWQRVAVVAARAQGAEEDSQEQSSPASGRNVKPSRTEEANLPSTSGRTSPSSPPQQNSNWWRKPKWRWNLNWNWKGAPAVQAHEIGALLLQLSVVVLFMRLLRPGVPFPGPSTAAAAEPNVPTAYVSVPFSEFLNRINRNDVENVEVDGVHFTFSLRLKARQAELSKDAKFTRSSTPAKRICYTTTRPSDMSTPYQKMIENGVDFGAPDKRSMKLINSLSITLLYLALFAGLLGRFPLKLPQRSTGRLRGRKGLLSGGGKDRDGGGPVMFADVAGVDEAKEELEEIVEFLKNPERYSRLGARPPRGVLLVGPPGTGKTLLAKAVAGEADVPFISCSASEFVELYVGMGASRVRDLFARAKKDAPSIVFIDEIDAVAKGRDGRLRSVGNDEREQTLNQLLTELDGFESNSTVIVLGATNRADVLDPALRRPGRFDRIVMVEPPDRQGREEILNVHVLKKQLPLATDVDINVIAAATAGFTGADLANLVNEAALLAGRASKLEVGKEEFSRAVERSIAGIEKKRSTLHGSEKSVVARHEAGHAVVGTAVAKFIPGQSRVQKLSILPRTGGTLGFTYIPPAAEDRYLFFVDELRGRLVTLLGGRAAEEVVYSGRVSTGALDDIKRATDVAYKAVAEYGLNSSIGPMSLATLSGGGLDESGGSFPWGKDQGQVVDMVQKEVRTLLQSALAVSLLVIRLNLAVLEGLGAQLEAEERLEGEDLENWLNMVEAPMELAAFIRSDYVAPAEQLSTS
ncbi:unnamed protein product [Sphagnum jensenii]|uniref:AAA+ ATPase domain-containing protein n=1 Tax=Sphagnum jensenii TaxID=128206 RepID=A0ABP0WIQ9_9BRYO